MKHELVIFNYAMDEKSPVFAHQLDSALCLSKRFSNTTVVTAYKPSSILDLPQNIRVISTNWIPGKPFRNIFNFYRISLPIILKKRIQFRSLSVFSHMTDSQAALISPITRLCKIRHVFWYAHTSLSPQLRFAARFVDKIVTSTNGSCPELKRDVQPLGQAIDPSLFPFKPKTRSKLVNGVHVGRLDRSKNLEEIIISCKTIRALGVPITFTQVGSPSNSLNESFAQGLHAEFQSDMDSGWLRFVQNIPRFRLQETFLEMDFFIHAFQGSLDKALLEATCYGLPVVTINSEYVEIFGCWGESQNLSLVEEFLALSKLTAPVREAELERRARIVFQEHSLDHWISSLAQILSE